MSAKGIDAVEKRFLGPVQRRAFQKPARIENIDSSILDFRFYYCPFPGVEHSLADFFESIGQTYRLRYSLIVERADVQAFWAPAGASITSTNCPDLD
jgi:hypothetical protein